MLTDWVAPAATFRLGDRIGICNILAPGYVLESFGLPYPAGAHLFTLRKTGMFSVYYLRYGLGTTAAQSDTITVVSPVRNPGTVRNWPPPGTQLVLFGDDLAAGVGGGASNRFAAALSSELHVPVTDAGNPNDTSRTALLRLQTIIHTGQPGTILICIRGANDRTAGIPPYETVGNVRTMVENAMNAGWVTVLIGAGDESFCVDGSGLHGIARDTSVVYLPNVMDEVLGDMWLTTPDGTMPNADGYGVIVNRMLPTLELLPPQSSVQAMLLKIRNTASGAELTWNSRVNYTYIIEWTPALEPAMWRPLSQCAGTGSEIRFPLNTSGAGRFFRLIQVAQ
jgi:acyl-CoA thioesterase-1